MRTQKYLSQQGRYKLSARKYQCFLWQGQMWQFQVLLFGQPEQCSLHIHKTHEANIVLARCDSEYLPG